MGAAGFWDEVLWLPELPEPEPPELVPLPELIAAAKGLSSSSVKVSRIYETLLNELGNEFFLLREAKISDIAAVSSENIADAIACLRDGKVHWNPGFDGQFGTMELVHPFRQLNSD